MKTFHQLNADQQVQAEKLCEQRIYRRLVTDYRIEKGVTESVFPPPALDDSFRRIAKVDAEKMALRSIYVSRDDVVIRGVPGV